MWFEHLSPKNKLRVVDFMIRLVETRIRQDTASSLRYQERLREGQAHLDELSRHRLALERDARHSA